MNKKNFTFVFALFLIGIFITNISATQVTLNNDFPQGFKVVMPNIDPIQSNTSYLFTAQAYNSSSGALVGNSTVSCTLDLWNKTGNHFIHQSMSYDLTGKHFYYLVEGGNLTKDGYMTASVYCQNSGEGGYFEQTFQITPSGLKIDTGQAILYIGVMGLLIFILLSLFYMGINMPNENETDSEGQLFSLNKFRYVRPTILFFSYVFLVLVIGFFNVIVGSYFNLDWMRSLLSTIFYVSLVGILPAMVITLYSLIVQLVTSKELKKTLQFRGLG